jgi:hypothetical protein
MTFQQSVYTAASAYLRRQGKPMNDITAILIGAAMAVSSIAAIEQRKDINELQKQVAVIQDKCQ